MNQTTLKTISLKRIFEESDGEKYCTYIEFRDLWEELVEIIVREGLGMGKKVKFPFGIGTFKAFIYKPKKYKLDRKLTKEYGVDYYDEWTDLDGMRLKIMWLNAYNIYPNISYYIFSMSGTMFKLLRKYTGENKLTEKI